MTAASTKDNYFIMTGPMGSGKSTLLKALREQGQLCVDEPARQILMEQRVIQADGVPERDPKIFTALLLSRSVEKFQQMTAESGPVLFDRGIADCIAYAKLFDLTLDSYYKAARVYRFNPRVFFLPAWEDIYENDEERKMTFEQARQFGQDLRKIYISLGYSIIELPKVSAEARAGLILVHMQASKQL